MNKLKQAGAPVPAKRVVGTLEMVALGIRLSLQMTGLLALVLTPFLLWDFFWHGVLPAILGHGDAGMYREGHAIVEGAGIRVMALILLAAPPYAVIVWLPDKLDALIRKRLGAEPGGEGASANGTDGAAPMDWPSASYEEGVQVNPIGDVTPYGALLHGTEHE